MSPVVPVPPKAVSTERSTSVLMRVFWFVSMFTWAPAPASWSGSPERVNAPAVASKASRFRTNGSETSCTGPGRTVPENVSRVAASLGGAALPTQLSPVDQLLSPPSPCQV